MLLAWVPCTLEPSEGLRRRLQSRPSEAEVPSEAVAVLRLLHPWARCTPQFQASSAANLAESSEAAAARPAADGQSEKPTLGEADQSVRSAATAMRGCLPGLRPKSRLFPPGHPMCACRGCMILHHVQSPRRRSGKTG